MYESAPSGSSPGSPVPSPARWQRRPLPDPPRPHGPIEPGYMKSPPLELAELSTLRSGLRAPALLRVLERRPGLASTDGHRLALALAAAGYRKAGERVLACGTGWMVLPDEQGHGALVGQHCDHRLCEPCAQARSAETAERLRALAEPELLAGRRVALVTLTLPDVPLTVGDLKAQQKRFSDAVARWTRSRSKDRLPWLAGGYASTEVVPHRGRAHLHWHCLWVLEPGAPRLATPCPRGPSGRARWAFTDAGRDLAVQWHGFTGPCGPDCQAKRRSLRGEKPGCTCGGSLHIEDVAEARIVESPSGKIAGTSCSLHIDPLPAGQWMWRAVDAAGLRAHGPIQGGGCWEAGTGEARTAAVGTTIDNARAQADGWARLVYGAGAVLEWSVSRTINPEDIRHFGQASKYVTKMCKVRGKALQVIVEWMRGVHLGRVWGCWWGTPLTTEHEHLDGCPICHRYNEGLWARAHAAGYNPAKEMEEQAPNIREIMAPKVDPTYLPGVPLRRALLRYLHARPDLEPAEEAVQAYWGAVLRSVLPRLELQLDNGTKLPPAIEAELDASSGVPFLGPGGPGAEVTIPQGSGGEEWTERSTSSLRATCCTSF